jgi:stress-induced-phosphoprotein 1
MADEAKAKGNAAFSAGKYEVAIQHFGEAIALAPDNHVLYSNRSAAYASLHKYQEALQDAKKTVELKAEWPKGYSRLGAAYVGLREYDDAISAYEKGLKFDPVNDGLKSGLLDAKAAKPRARGPPGDSPFGGGSPFGNMFGPDVWVKLQSDPRTRPYLQQPDFVAMITDSQKNPSNVSRYINDPRMMQVIGVLLGVNIQNAESGAEFQDDGKDEEVSSTSKSESPAERPRSVLRPDPVPEPAPKPMEVETEDVEEKERKARKAEALKEKEAGNAEYKKKNFEVAVEHYSKAVELDGEDISFVTNRAAVYMEMGKVRVVNPAVCESVNLPVEAIYVQVTC